MNDEDNKRLLKAKELLAKQLISKNDKIKLEHIFDELNAIGIPDVHRLLDQLVIPCLSDKRAFDFAFDMLEALLVSNNNYIFAWTKPLQDRMTRFFVRFMHAMKEDKTNSNEVSRYYQLYIQKLIDNKIAESAENVSFAYFEYAERILQMANNGMLNSNFVSSMSEFSEPILSDFKEIFECNKLDIAYKFIEWLPHKHELPFLFHCAIYAIKSELWDKKHASFDCAELVFKKAQRIMEVCYWPIFDRARKIFDERHLKMLHEFDLLNVFSEALYSDLCVNPEHRFVPKNEDPNYRDYSDYTIKLRFPTKNLSYFLIEQFPSSFARLFIDQYTYFQEMEKIDTDGDESQQKIEEQIANSAIECLSSFFDTINKICSAVKLRDIWPNDGELELFSKNMQELNKWQETFITTRLYFSTHQKLMTKEVFEQMCKSFNKLLAFQNVAQIEHVIWGMRVKPNSTKPPLIGPTFEDDEQSTPPNQVHDSNAFNVPKDKTRPMPVRGTKPGRGSYGKVLAKFHADQQQKEDGSD